MTGRGENVRFTSCLGENEQTAQYSENPASVIPQNILLVFPGGWDRNFIRLGRRHGLVFAKQTLWRALQVFCVSEGFSVIQT